jgi:hypothetical protein
MIVEFQATLDDFADVTRRSQRLANAVPPTGRPLLISAILLTILLFAVSPFSLAEKLSAVALAGVVYAGIYFFLADRGPLYKSTIRQIYSRELGSIWPVTVRVELDESGITFTQNGIPSLTAWSAIDGIEETPDAIYFLTTDPSVMAVRKRAFESAADQARFLRLVAHFLGNGSVTLRD